MREPAGELREREKGGGCMQLSQLLVFQCLSITVVLGRTRKEGKKGENEREREREKGGVHACFCR